MIRELCHRPTVYADVREWILTRGAIYFMTITVPDTVDPPALVALVVTAVDNTVFAIMVSPEFVGTPIIDPVTF
jgi:hypothetical protein